MFLPLRSFPFLQSNDSMTGVWAVAAAAAVLAIGFIPWSECRKVPGIATGSLSPLPVVLTQIHGDEGFTEVPCNALQIVGHLAPTETVKFTGSGWAGDRLEFLVSRQTGGVDQVGDSAVGTPAVSLVIIPPAQNEAGGASQAAKALLMQYPTTSEQEATSTEVSLPITSTDHGFMFICSMDPARSVLKCEVSGYDNRQDDATGTWDTTVVELPIGGLTENLRFSLNGDRIHAPMIYVTPGVTYATGGAGLLCHAEDETAEHSAPAVGADEGNAVPTEGGDSVPTEEGNSVPMGGEISPTYVRPLGAAGEEA